MKRIAIIAILAIAALVGCTQIQTAQTKIDSTLANSADTVAMACWGIQAADAVFKTTYAVGAKADPAIVADEAKAVAGATAICANPPANTAQALADVMGAYKAVQNATPAQVATAP